MRDGVLKKMKSVEPRAGYRLLISWVNGPQMIVDLSEMVQKGGVFEALRNESEFAKVRLEKRGRLVEWPEPHDDHGYPMIEVDAESLQMMGNQQRATQAIKKLFNAARSMERAERSP